MTYTIRVERDDASKGDWMVCIYSDDGVGNVELVGIPLRGVSNDACCDAQQSIVYAFEYGLAAATEEARKTVDLLQTRVHR